jgi:hypothetical protein
MSLTNEAIIKLSSQTYVFQATMRHILSRWPHGSRVVCVQRGFCHGKLIPIILGCWIYASLYWCKDLICCFVVESVIAQAVSRRLPTVAARVRARVNLFEICGGQKGTRAGFLRVLRFPHANSHSTDCSTIIIIIISHLGLLKKAKQWPQY